VTQPARKGAVSGSGSRPTSAFACTHEEPSLLECFAQRRLALAGAIEAHEGAHLPRRDPELLAELRIRAKQRRQLRVDALLERHGPPQARVELEGVGVVEAGQ